MFDPGIGQKSGRQISDTAGGFFGCGQAADLNIGESQLNFDIGQNDGEKLLIPVDARMTEGEEAQ